MSWGAFRLDVERKKFTEPAKWSELLACYSVRSVEMFFSLILAYLRCNVDEAEGAPLLVGVDEISSRR